MPKGKRSRSRSRNRRQYQNVPISQLGFTCCGRRSTPPFKSDEEFDEYQDYVNDLAKKEENRQKFYHGLLEGNIPIREFNGITSDFTDTAVGAEPVKQKNTRFWCWELQKWKKVKKAEAKVEARRLIDNAVRTLQKAARAAIYNTDYKLCRDIFASRMKPIELKTDRFRIRFVDDRYTGDPDGIPWLWHTDNMYMSHYQMVGLAKLCPGKLSPNFVQNYCRRKRIVSSPSDKRYDV